LQSNLNRLAPDTRYSDAVVREFIANMDTVFVSVTSPEGHRYTFPEGARVIDYAYAAGSRIGAIAQRAVLLYPDGRSVKADLDDPLVDGAEIILEPRLINNDTPVSINLEHIQRLDMAQTEVARERIAETLADVISGKNDKLVVPQGESVLEKELTRSEIAYAIRQRGWNIFEAALTAALKAKQVWPGERITRVIDAPVFADTKSQKRTDRYEAFLRDVGLLRISPTGKRRAYFERIVRSVVNKQSSMIRIYLDVDDIPKMAIRINSAIAGKGKRLVNISYELTIQNPDDSRSTRVTRVIDGLNRSLVLKRILPQLDRIDGVTVVQIAECGGAILYESKSGETIKS
jgi:hypothetical protein